MTIEKVANFEAEAWVLGAALLHRGAAPMDQVAASLKPQDFASERNQILFRAMLALSSSNSPIDAVTLIEALEGTGELDKVSIAYVASLTDGFPDIDITRHIAIVKRYSRRRRYARWSHRLYLSCLDPESTDEDLAAALEQPDDVEEYRDPLRPFGVSLADRRRDIERLADSPGEAAGLRTTLPALDRATGGIRATELWVVGAIPGAGKTALLGQMAHGNAAIGGTPVGVFSLEMSEGSLVDRILALDLGISPRKLRDPRLLTTTDRQDICDAEGRLAGLPIVTDETPGLTLAALRGRARLMRRRHAVELIVVDYLQLVVGPGDSTRDRVGAVARGLKNLAKELNVGILAASQLRATGEGRERPPDDTRPQGVWRDRSVGGHGFAHSPPVAPDAQGQRSP